MKEMYYVKRNPELIDRKVIEDIKTEIVNNRDEWIKGQDAEWHTYDRCLQIIDRHLGSEVQEK